MCPAFVNVHVDVNNLLAMSESDFDNSGEPGPHAKGVSAPGQECVWNSDERMPTVKRMQPWFHELLTQGGRAWIACMHHGRSSTDAVAVC